jgi:uracil-DNA glycosylase family 4
LKSELCKDCELLTCPGPVMGEFTGGQVDVMFVGEALGAIEVQQHRPMVGMAGQVLRRTLDSMNFTSYGITNIFKCRPPGNELPESSPGTFCKQSLIEDLTTRRQKLTVLLGGTALNAVMQAPTNISQVIRRLFSVTVDGKILPVMGLWHPSSVNRRGNEWRDWELGFDKIQHFLKGEVDYIPPEQRHVTQCTTFGETFKALSKLKELAPTHTIMSCDIETSAGYSPWAGARIISVAIAYSPTEAFAVTWDSVGSTTNFDMLKSLLEDESIAWLWYNGQFDTQFFRHVGIIPRIGFDGMLEANTVDERENPVHSLKRDSGVFLDAPDWESDIKQYVPKKEDSFELIPVDKLLNYNGLDAVHTFHLSSVLQRTLIEEKELDYYKRVVIPTYDMLSEARFEGIRVDMFRVKELQNQIQPVLDDLLQQMITLTNNPYFNPNSYRDKLEALHARKIMVENTRKETLQQYEGDELVDLIRNSMDASKILGTYIVGIADDVYDDLRVHPDWKTPAETGRPRCADPNMLGMPRKAEVAEHRWKRYVKEIFVADPGTLLMQLDRKQSEVRCEVFLANDTEFIEHLKTDRNADIHGEYTKMVYGPGYTKEQRVLIKMVVFGLLYNRQAFSLAKQFTAIEREKAKKEGKTTYHVWSEREAQKFIDKFFSRIPKVYVHMQSVMKEALKTGYLTSYLGRIRRFGLVNQENRKSIANQAVNFPPSSLSADLNFLSCVETRKRYGKYGVRILVPVHDSGLMRIPKDSKDLPAEIQGMWEDFIPKLLHTDLPFTCDIGIGERWSDL